MTTWQINLHEDGLDLLAAMQSRVPLAPAGYLRQLCKKQRVSINTQAAEGTREVHLGDRVTIMASSRWRELLALAPLQPGQVLHEDAWCLIIDKPAGLATHHAQGHDDDLLQRVRSHLRLRGETYQVAPVHRLDRGTSGAILFGKGKKAIGALGQMFMAGEITKHYLALAYGRLSVPGQLDAPVSAKGQVKAALTRYRPITTHGDLTLLALELVTGRQHQIRQQLARAGHPLAGDNRYSRRLTQAGRLMLHCHRLVFENPLTGRTVHVTAPLDTDFQQVLAQNGFDEDWDDADITQKTANRPESQV